MADLFSDITIQSTHTLWVEARKFVIDIARSSATTLTVTVSRPATYNVVDGAVVTLGTKPITPDEYPADGKQYIAGTVWGDASADKIGAAQVIGFWSEILQTPFPASTSTSALTEVGTVGTKLQWQFEVTGIDPKQIYYVSVHPSSQVLQYYPLGIQSYPLESNSVETEGSTSYAASIPSFPTAPTSPSPGMVYFDKQLNSVQYWDTARQVWIPTRTDQIISGEYNPGIPGMAYLSGQQLKLFNGKTWVAANETNLQFRAGSQWLPLRKISTNVRLPDAPIPGEFVYNYTSNRAQYWDGSQWLTPDATSALFNNGSGVIPAFTAPFKVEPVDLLTPYVGLLFYNTTKRQLMAWNGNTWEIANTDQNGTPTSDKTGIGNDGTYDQRLRLVNILKSQLGWPALCVELSEEQFNIAIDNALDTYRQLCIGAYEHRYILYHLMQDQQTYFLNSPVDQTDRVVTVIKVHRMQFPGYSSSGPNDVWAQSWAQTYYQSNAGGGDLLSANLLANWGDEFTRTFAGDLPFTWYEARRELTIHRGITGNQKVVLEVEMERTEQELMLDRYCKQFIQNWALAEAKETLGLIRSKYTSGTPGAAGTITLNGDLLVAEARQDFSELKQALLDYEHQNAEHGNLALLMG